MVRKRDTKSVSNTRNHIENPTFYGIDARVYYEKAIRLCIAQGRICLLVIRQSEIVEILLKPVLCRKAGITQVAALILPLLQAAVVEHLDVVLDDKRHDAISQTFFEKKQA